MPSACVGTAFIRPYINLGYGRDHPDGVNSLPELIAFNARYNPNHLFGLQGRTGEDAPFRITFSQLQAAVENASSWLVKTGSTTGRTRRGQVIRPVAILLGSDIGIFIYMAALLRIGTPVLCLSARLTPIAITHLLEKTSPSTVLISGQVMRSVKDTISLLEMEPRTNAIRFLDALAYEDLMNINHPEVRGIPVPPMYTAFQYNDRDACILHSSGTTGLPKPIYHTQVYLLLYAACHRIPEQNEPFHFNVSTLPLYHGFGLLAPSLSLSLGLPFVLPPASTIPTATSTLATLRATGANFMFTVPSILEDILNLPGGAGLDALKTLEIVAVGGAPMKESIGRKLVEHGVKLLNHWGATEISAIAPIERIPCGYDWHYLMPRTDIGLELVKQDDHSGTYRLIGHPPGWTEPYVVQDLLIANPRDSKQVKILGRADDLIVLATGEKIRPAKLERAVAEHPDVKDVLAFGDGQLSLGLLVELSIGRVKAELERPENLAAFITDLESFLERGNSFTDKHGKVTKEMIIITRENTKPLIRTDKGSLARKATFAAFENEIKSCYIKADTLKAVPLPLPTVNGGLDLLGALRSLIRSVTGSDEGGNSREADNIDFFEAGMDSLQASRLRRAIMSSLRVTPNLPIPVHDLDLDFCFQNSTLTKLHRAVSRLMSGAYSRNISGTKQSRRIAAIESMVQFYRSELRTYADLARKARDAQAQHMDAAEDKYVVVLTGSTGSLGCFLLSRLASDPNVSKVICLNRKGLGGIRERQMEALHSRGASLEQAQWAKVVLHEADMSRSDFGLDESEFSQLLRVTHIFHNAWPVNFNRNLASFEPHVKALSNLVRLSLLSAGTRSASSPPTRLLFASSIAVAGRFPIMNPDGPLEVPEVDLEAASTAEFGYPEAKWVCERVLKAAYELYGNTSPDGEEPLLLTSTVRIGQMTGPEGWGAWNADEHIPIIVRTSQSLKALPAIDGSLSWMPVNRAAKVLAELLFSKGFKPIYHLENPSRQSWGGVLYNLASVIGGSDGPLPLIPFPEWLHRVRALGDDPEHNAAYKVLDFLERDFERMAAGSVILRTSATREDSPTMVRSTALDRKHVEEYVTYWRRIGVLN